MQFDGVGDFSLRLHRHLLLVQAPIIRPSRRSCVLEQQRLLDIVRLDLRLVAPLYSHAAPFNLLTAISRTIFRLNMVMFLPNIVGSSPFLLEVS